MPRARRASSRIPPTPLSEATFVRKGDATPELFRSEGVQPREDLVDPEAERGASFRQSLEVLHDAPLARKAERGEHGLRSRIALEHLPDDFVRAERRGGLALLLLRSPHAYRILPAHSGVNPWREAEARLVRSPPCGF